MLQRQNQFEVLARRVERGDVTAAPELRRLLEGALRPVVRRALRGGSSELDRRIRAVALRVVGGPDDFGRANEVVEEAGASLSARVVGRLRAGANSIHAGYETVVA
jgi:hypothetical protein